ncbi:MAG: inositol monophosphatase [Elusimicrobiales bacterium]|nr:inositol monophosphatase [Elusimicrobiales bacterium]
MTELETLKKALNSASTILKKYFGKVNYSLKGRADLLTKADIESQKAVIKIIRKSFPSHSIFAEESEKKETAGRFIWVIDPLDGTTNYAHTFPIAGVSIALLKNGKAILGGISDPFRNETFIGIKGKGAYLNNKKIRVSKVPKLSQALLSTGFGYDRAEKAEFYCSIYKDFLKISHDIRRCGSASLDMAWLAAGRTDGYWEFSLSPWDVAAGKIIVEEAGGKVSDFGGKKWGNMSEWGKETLATNGKFPKEMLKIIKKEIKENG